MENRIKKYYNHIGIRPSIVDDEIFGDVYVVDNLVPLSKYPEKFIGLSTKTNKFYFFDCVCCDKREFIEYLVVKLDYKDIFDIDTLKISVLELYKRKENEIYSYLADTIDVEYEKVNFDYLDDEDLLPRPNEYIVLKKNTFNEIMLLSSMLYDNKLIENKKEED